MTSLLRKQMKCTYKYQRSNRLEVYVAHTIDDARDTPRRLKVEESALAMHRSRQLRGFVHHCHACPVNFSYASRYLLAVSRTTSAGMATPSLPFRPEPVNQSRRYCLSYDCCPLPISYFSDGQKRELSGVRTSSIKMISFVVASRPNSNFVSAMIIPRFSA